ncbi:unnamed protein product [Orchesella dallaii]|uniref:Uncharacterized protein n=1 Tax=Orchesella dallaii TaxID=48710 RepID=A0ABP1RTK1_9HEXA
MSEVIHDTKFLQYVFSEPYNMVEWKGKVDCLFCGKTTQFRTTGGHSTQVGHFRICRGHKTNGFNSIKDIDPEETHKWYKRNYFAPVKCHVQRSIRPAMQGIYDHFKTAWDIKDKNEVEANHTTEKNLPMQVEQLTTDNIRLALENQMLVAENNQLKSRNNDLQQSAESVLRQKGRAEKLLKTRDKELADYKILVANMQIQITNMAIEMQERAGKSKAKPDSGVNSEGSDSSREGSVEWNK